MLVEAAQHISMAVHEEAHNNAANSSDPLNSNVPSTAYSYSLDNLSDDEMAGDSSQSSDSALPSSLVRNQSNSSITTAQLAAALSRAGARGFPRTGSSSSSSRASGNSGVITTEMFTQAMQQAFASAPTPSAAVATPSVPETLPQSVDIQRHLAQMHEIGLLDDAVNLQALQVTGGDVQAAIELVFNGLSDN